MSGSEERGESHHLDWFAQFHHTGRDQVSSVGAHNRDVNVQTRRDKMVSKQGSQGQSVLEVQRALHNGPR